MILMSFVSFFPIFIADNLLDRDVNLVIGPLTGVNSLQDYYDIFITKALTDIQPVRDIFLLLDIQLTKLIGFQVFGISNWIIWILCCLVAEKIALKYSPSSPITKILLLILACHPMLAWVISWPLAKKHLLASLFCLLASLKAVEFKEEQEETGFLIFLFFFLALLSQPILIFWPVVFFFYLGKKKTELRSIKLLTVLFLSSLMIGLITLFYYSKLLPLYFGMTITQPPFFYGASQRLFAFSRAYTQVLLPLSFSGNYSLVNPLGFIGLPLLSVILIAKLKDYKKALFFLLLISYPLLSANTKITSVFLSDTYLVSSLLGVFLLLSYKPNRTSKMGFIFFALVLIYAVPKSLYESKIASNESSYLLKSYTREPECKNIISLSEYMLRVAKIEDFIHYSGISLKNRCFLKGFNPQFMINDLYAFRVFFDENLSTESKLESFRKNKFISPDVLYLQIVLLHKLDRTEDAQKFTSELPIEALKYKEAIKKIIESECSVCPKI